MLSPLDLTPSFGFGDRLGLATPGHIAAVHGTKFAPIFAHQCVGANGTVDDFHAREGLHVTLGSALARFDQDLKAALVKHKDVYYDGLKAHFDKHLMLLK